MQDFFSPNFVNTRYRPTFVSGSISTYLTTQNLDRYDCPTISFAIVFVTLSWWFVLNLPITSGKVSKFPTEPICSTASGPRYSQSPERRRDQSDNRHSYPIFIFHDICVCPIKRWRVNVSKAEQKSCYAKKPTLNAICLLMFSTCNAVVNMLAYQRRLPVWETARNQTSYQLTVTKSSSTWHRPPTTRLDAIDRKCKY